MDFSQFMYRFVHRVSTKLVSGFFSFSFFTRKLNPPTPHTHKHKNMAQRNARSRSETAAPSGVRSVLIIHLRTCKLQRLSRIRTLCQASRKIPGVGPKLPICLDCCTCCSVLFCFINFDSPEHFPKSNKMISERFLRSDFNNLWDPFHHQFSLHFTTRRKQIFCNIYNAKCMFSLLKASQFGISNPFNNHGFVCK